MLHRPSLVRSIGLPAIIAVVFASPTSADACTGIRLIAQDGTPVQARTVEWGLFDLKSKLIVIPRGETLVGETPDGKPGLKWTTKHGIVGINALEQPKLIDGLNEKGLVVGVFYLPGYAEYPKYDPAQANVSMGPLDLAVWMLSNFTTAAEVRENLSKVRVAPVVEPALKIPPPVHFLVTDATGKSIVIEFVKGQQHVYDNPIGVITNSPTFDWHVTNLRNYTKLTPKDAPTIKINGVELKPIGAGSGMFGLPGDFSPPSRFVRATALTQTAVPLKDGPRAVDEAFRILNNFDIPLGMMAPKENLPLDAIEGDTQWTSAADLVNLRYYYHTMHNRRLRMVDLKAIDFTKPGVRQLPLDRELKQDIEAVPVK